MVITLKEMSVIDCFSLTMQNISDKSLQLVSDNYRELESLNLTRYVNVILSELAYLRNNNV